MKIEDTEDGLTIWAVISGDRLKKPEAVKIEIGDKTLRRLDDICSSLREIGLSFGETQEEALCTALMMQDFENESVKTVFMDAEGREYRELSIEDDCPIFSKGNYRIYANGDVSVIFRYLDNSSKVFSASKIINTADNRVSRRLAKAASI